MKGVISIEGACLFLWIDGAPLTDAIEGEWMLVEVTSTGTIFKVKPTGYDKPVYPELRGGRLVLRTPHHFAPRFDWAKEEVEEIEIILPQGYEPYLTRFTIPAGHLPPAVGNFRLWANKKLIALTQRPTDENGLLPLLVLARDKGWMYKYTARKKAGLAVSSNPRVTPKDHLYQVDFRPEHRQLGRKDAGPRTVVAPNWGSFLASVEALVGADDVFPDLTKGG